MKGFDHANLIKIIISGGIVMERIGRDVAYMGREAAECCLPVPCQGHALGALIQ